MAYTEEVRRKTGAPGRSCRLWPEEHSSERQKYMSKVSFKPSGVCSREMSVEAEDGVITQVKITGGCDGNSDGLSRLLVGMRVDDAIGRMRGTRCGKRPTSCPDQLARAMEQLPK